MRNKTPVKVLNIFYSYSILKKIIYKKKTKNYKKKKTIIYHKIYEKNTNKKYMYIIYIIISEQITWLKRG